MLKQFLVIVLLASSFLELPGQSLKHVRLHAHNDYQHQVPFWLAFVNGFASIEADVFLQDDQLFVAHEQKSIQQERTLTSLYFQPIEQALKLNLWSNRQLQLLIDIKSDAYKTLDKIIETVKSNSSIIKATEEGKLVLVISGNRPAAAEFSNYPDFIHFDYQSLDDPGDKTLEKIAMISMSFAPVSRWNGKGRLVDEDLKKVKEIVAKAHALNKPFRFWATPDSKTAWQTFSYLGVDFINTDMPGEASAYMSTLAQNTYSSQSPHTIYQPTFKSDGTSTNVKNIILLIGDGMGLAQISAGMFANHNQLALTQIKNLGLTKTQSADDFTTDSAAGGTALATGEKTKNRYIGVDPNGKNLLNLPEQIQHMGFQSGIVTTDHLTGATPASFYAHQTERDWSAAIANDLAKSPVALAIGAGKSDFKNNDILKDANIKAVVSLEELVNSREDKVAFFLSENSLPDKLHGRGNVFPDAVAAALQFLSKKKTPFFLVVEGGFIDSGGHANNTGLIVEEMLDFDLAVEQALRFADENNETLVIVTADHETGGFSLPHGNVDSRTIEGQFHSNDHTGIMVPVFAYGPHSQDFCGVYENIAIYEKIMKIIINSSTEKDIRPK